MTTCSIQKFYNVAPSQISGLMRLVGSEHNNGKTRMWLAYKEPDGYGSLARNDIERGPEKVYRHISVMRVEPSKEVHGTFTVEVKVNGFLEPAPEEKIETCSNGLHWTNREDGAPVPVPRSLVLAMHDTLGIFLPE